MGLARPRRNITGNKRAILARFSVTLGGLVLSHMVDHAAHGKPSGLSC